ncbi:MAG: ACT domain-containing protein [Candidatus Micrarchaeota archaeon]
MKSITIVAEDKVGLLADISYILAKSKINIETVSVDVVGGKAIISLGVGDITKAKQVVEASGYKVEDPEAVVIKLSDKADEVNRVTKMLTEEGVDVKNVRMLTKDSNNTVLAILVDKPKKAALILQPHLITTQADY